MTIDVIAYRSACQFYKFDWINAFRMDDQKLNIGAPADFAIEGPSRSRRKKRLYWACQIVGWSLFVLLTGLINNFRMREFDMVLIVNLISTFVIGLTTSHFFRWFIVRNDWLKLKISQLIHRVLIASTILAAVFYFLHTMISELLVAQNPLRFEFNHVLLNLINLMAIYIFWSSLYWVFHFVQNYKKEEIKNLKWEAAISEMELNKIKSQLNPHFVFNSMNSIRALVEEHPKKAKEAITQLSNILRSSLLMGKQRFITFEEEMRLVNDYLSLEKTRLEERLNVDIDVDPATSGWRVPPMMIQTLVENGIKHGVSKLPKGGKIDVQARVEDQQLLIVIENSGKYLANRVTGTGFGLKNSVYRLKLLYGDKASLNVEDTGLGTVKASMVLPHAVEVEERHLERGQDHNEFMTSSESEKNKG